MTRERSDADFGRVLGAWMDEAAPPSIPVVVLEEAFARTMTATQLRVYPWQRLARRSERPRRLTLLTVAATAALLVGILGFGVFGAGSGIAPGPSPSPTPLPTAAPSPSPTPAPSAGPSVRPGYATPRPGLGTPQPLVPASPLPDPAGSPLPTELLGRVYNGNPLEVQGIQALLLTLRAADDPHCLAMFQGRSTCFTILWTPNFPKHITDPAVRGPARIVDGQLALGFALIPNGRECEGTTSTYAIEDGGDTLRGVDVPACSGFPGWTPH